jgi:hypothetical protein
MEKTPAWSRRLAVRCDSTSGALVFSFALPVPQPGFMGIVTARLKPGPFPKYRRLDKRKSTGDQTKHKVPPLRFAPVGMTELFWRARGRVGGIVSHPSAKNALGWATLGLVWARKSRLQKSPRQGGAGSSLGVSGFARDAAASGRQRGIRDRNDAAEAGPFPRTICETQFRSRRLVRVEFRGPAPEGAFCRAFGTPEKAGPDTNRAAANVNFPTLTSKGATSGWDTRHWSG